MNDRPSTKRVSDESTLAPIENKDLAEVLRRRPEVIENRPAFLDMVQADYWRCCQDGAALSASTYCSRLPIDDDALLLSIRRLVEVERYFLENPELLSLTGDPDWPSEGETFDGFLLEKEIGRGGASRVYRARQLDIGRRVVVLKVTTYAKAEAQVMGRSEHPGVGQVYSTGVEPGTGLHWICMPYLSERTLQTELDRQVAATGTRRSRGLPLSQVRRIASGIAEALAYLHEQGIQHGDLKPSNILLRDDGQPMLIDFNLSQLDSAENALVGGTLPYMPPEALRLFTAEDGNKPTLGTERAIAADIYAFGCTLFQMLTGRPYVSLEERETDPHQIADRLLEAQVAAAKGLSTELANAPTRLSRIATQCLALSSQDRPRSLTEVAKELRRDASVLRGVPLRPTLVGVISLALLVVLLAVVSLASDPQSRLKYARQLVQQGQLREAQTVLTTLSAHPEVGVPSRRLLGEALLDEGKIDQSAEVLDSLAVETKDAMTYALAGYVDHLRRNDAIAGSNDRSAIQGGYRTPSVLNNYAAGLLRALVDQFEPSYSTEIAKLLKEAIRLDPLNETIRINTLRHIEVLATLGLEHDYHVVDVLQPPLREPSSDYLRLACRYLVSDSVPDEDFARVGLPLLYDLREEFGDSALQVLLGTQRWERYRALPEYVAGDGTSEVRMTSRPSPPVFLDPRRD